MAAPSITFKVEVELSGHNNGWTDISADLMADAPMSWGHGAKGNQAGVHTTSPGAFAFTLNNGANNSASTIGYYSPWHEARRVGWRVGIKVRLTVTMASLSTSHFIGWINRIDPTLGLHAPMVVRVMAGDAMEMLSRTQVTNAIPTLIGEKFGYAFLTLYGAIPTDLAVDGLYYDIVFDSYGCTYMFDSIRKDRPVLLAEYQRLAASAHARVVLDQANNLGLVSIPWGTYGGAFDNSVDTGITITGDDIVSARFPQDRATIVNNVRGATTKRTIDSVNVTLFQVESDFNPAIRAGKSFKLKCQFVDPNQKGVRIGGANVVTPVATTDYTFNSAADGSGTNLTSSISISIQKNGADCVVTFTNNHATTTAYMTSFKIRGKGLYTYNPRKVEITDSGSQTAYGNVTLQEDLFYQEGPESIFVLGNGTVVDNTGALVDTLRKYSAPMPQNPSVTFIADTTTKAGWAHKSITAVGSHNGGATMRQNRVHVTETVGGIDNDFLIIGVERSWNPRERMLTCTWYLEPYGPIETWTVGESALDVDTVLG